VAHKIDYLSAEEMIRYIDRITAYCDIMLGAEVYILHRPTSLRILNNYYFNFQHLANNFVPFLFISAYLC
jgi:hypothetical protein